jgi:hypothetical protein
MSREVRAVIRATERVTEKVVTRLTLNITANLVETTPVDLGWARANWVPAIGVAFTGNSGNVDPDVAGVSAQSARQQAAIAAMTAYRLGRGSVFISNNVPYIPRLNAGSSRQAPAGFVQAAVREGVAQTAAQLRRLT